MYAHLRARLRAPATRSFGKPHRTRLWLKPLEERIAPAFSEFVDPHPAPGNRFGACVVPLATGNVVVTSPFDDAGGTDAGAVYLFNGATGALISTLTGSHANDRIGITNNAGIYSPVFALSNGNFVFLSSHWSNGSAVDAGAVTWGNGTTGISGVLSAANSLVGTSANEGVYSNVIPLNNGNYVVVNNRWDNGSIVDAGAVTWGNGTNGVSGVVSAANSLIGTNTNDQIGYINLQLPNGNYVVQSPNWDNGSIVDAGAVTWGSGTAGVTGPITASNSLVGSSANDQIGGNSSRPLNSVVVLSNGNYVVLNPKWDNGNAVDAGAVTWGSGTTGVSGVVTLANSLVGSSANDEVGYDFTALSNGNYLVISPSWSNGSIGRVGAVTWGNGASGISGVVNSSNSLVGNSAGDSVGNWGVTELTNGNYVVSSPNWDNGSILDAGAATWWSGTTTTSGVVSALNSLVGGKAYDNVGLGVKPLSNGNYVVSSIYWDNGSVTDAGAATWCNGSTGSAGTVSIANSLVGSKANDQVGTATALTNGNYVVSSFNWDNGSISNAGAVTWCDGTQSTIGAVSASNSLVGSHANDNVSAVTALANGNYVVRSVSWDNGSIVDAGAVTWCRGTMSTTGAVSSANSLVGGTANDSVGYDDITKLTNGNYVVRSRYWDNGAAVNAGAVTWGSGTTGVSGTVSAANSLVGSKSFDSVGINGVTVLANGNYVVSSTFWDNGAVTNAGAATWGNGATGVSGVITAANSLVGSLSADEIGIPYALPNGNYVVLCSHWSYPTIQLAGAAIWGNGLTGVNGTISASKAAIGSVSASMASTSGALPDNVNGTFLVSFPLDGIGGRVRVGSQSTGISTPAPVVNSVTFGDGTAQRSLVKQIVVNFSESVNFTAGVATAFTLHRSGTGGTTGDVALIANPTNGAASSVTITFSGSFTEHGSLIDGFYDFTIDASKITGIGGALDGDGNGTPGGNYAVIGTTANKFFRLFGDSDGNGTVNNKDFQALRAVFNQPSVVFDFDNDGVVTFDDMKEFRLRFGMTP